jgi:hypothetical protein
MTAQVEGLISQKERSENLSDDLTNLTGKAVERS